MIKIQTIFILLTLAFYCGAASLNFLFTDEVSFTIDPDNTQVVLNLVEGSNGPNCDLIPPLPNNLSQMNVNYTSINDGYPFGTSTNGSALLTMSNSRYAAMSEFIMPMQPFRRRIVFEDPPTSHNQADQSIISISLCPGDFSTTAKCVFNIPATSTLRISTFSDDDPDFYCLLVPGQTYYLNAINSPDPYNIQPYCAVSGNTECSLFFSETGL